jgi:polyhydroxyalkanoate synthase
MAGLNHQACGVLDLASARVVQIARSFQSIPIKMKSPTIAKQSQLLMRRFVSHQPDAIRFGMGGTPTLGLDFFELMTRMMTDPLAVATAQIDLFYDTLGIWQKTAERMLKSRHSDVWE